MHQRYLPPSFLDVYSLLTSSLRWKALCIVISFVVLWSICLSSSLVHFKNCPEYLTRVTAQVFILLMKFLPYSFVSSCFLVLLGYTFFFFQSPLVWWCPLPKFPSIFKFPFLQTSWFFLDLEVLFPLSCIISRFFYNSLAHFSMPNYYYYQYSSLQNFHSNLKCCYFIHWSYSNSPNSGLF